MMNQNDAMGKKNISDSELWDDPVLWQELESQTKDGTIDLFHLPPFSYIYFSKLSLLLKDKEAGTLPESMAEGFKACLLRDFHEHIAQDQNEKVRQKMKEAEEAYERAETVYAEYQKAIRTAGTLISEIEKSHSVSEIMDLACQIIGLLTGDSSFHARQLKKFPCDHKKKENQMSQNKV